MTTYSYGNTPTGVGKTLVYARLKKNTKKHPHRRGENPRNRQKTSTGSETPPQAWGKQLCDSRSRGGIRNTPTGVGKTTRNSPKRIWLRKHPHRRGENGRKSKNVGSSTETPPQAWGKRLPEGLEGDYDRNTPTGVGKTLLLDVFVVCIQKNPHRRGENILCH